MHFPATDKTPYTPPRHIPLDGCASNVAHSFLIFFYNHIPSEIKTKIDRYLNALFFHIRLRY